MIAAYPEILAFVQHLTPTWRKRQHVNFAQLVCALIEKGSLVLSELARAMPQSTQKLHGRLKRIDRFLDNPRLDEPALYLRWLRLSYRFGDELPPASNGQQLLPLLLDTVYFEPFALLVVTVPCGSRGLPVALTTYHRYELKACFPPKATWPSPLELPSRPRRGKPSNPASAAVVEFDSQNKLEEHLIDYVLALASPALLSVIVADRGFARAALLRWLIEHDRAFAIRFDAQTHIRLPEPLAPDLPTAGEPKQVLGLRPGQRIWCPEAYYSKEDQVPISLLAVWDPGQEEPWYIATSLETAEQTETVYRWRMRLECANRDEKTGVILREGGDQHALTSVLHLHRLLLALMSAEWLCALVGLQAWHDLPEQEAIGRPAQARPQPEPLPAPGALEASSRPILQQEPIPSVVGATPDSARSKPALPERSGSVEPTPSTPAAALWPTSSATASTPRVPDWATDLSILDVGPALPPPVLPHRGQTPRLPEWLRVFAARGWLSYVRLGKEVIGAVDFHQILRRMVRWLACYLWPRTPIWRTWQLRYRIRHWWFDSSRDPPISS